MTTNDQPHGPHGPGCRCGQELSCFLCGVPLPTEGFSCGECITTVPNAPLRIYCKPCAHKHMMGHAVGVTMGISPIAQFQQMRQEEDKAVQRRKVRMN